MVNRKIDSGYLKYNRKVIQKLRKIPILEALDKKEFQELLRISDIKKYKPGELILKEGVFDSSTYYLVSGKVRIIKGGKELVVLKRTGDIFGEMGIIDNSAKLASVYAINKTSCLVTDISQIDQLVGENRYILSYLLFKGFSEVLANRLKETTKALSKAKKIIKEVRKNN